MRHSFRYLCILIAVVSLILSSGVFAELRAQLTVVEGSAMNMTPEQLIQNYLIGEGITIFNATFNGSLGMISSTQIGTFATAGGANIQLGLPGGILMTSGKASLAIGPNNQTGAGLGTGGGGDPDLTAISGTATFDKALLEFDFIPQFDTIQFRYVFGSEEFFEYCNQINDAFGFFLSGPGISGTFSNNAINIALMPGSSSQYVTINNICGNTFSRWDNGGGVYYQYDALTYVFTATAVVTPCSTYHIKLAIADAVDHILDSGVFLEQNSFSAVGVEMSPSNSNPGIGNTAVEGCNDVVVNFLLSSPQPTAYTVNFLVSGTATNGVDYTLIPDHLTFPAGTDSLTIVIHPVLDLVPEGPENVIITIDQISCDGTVMADTIPILDYVPMTLQPMNDATVCHGEEVTLLSQPSEGLQPYTYTWNVPGGNDSILVLIPPVGNNAYTVQVTDLCLNSLYDTAMILVHPKPIASAGEDTTIANGTGITLHGIASGGYGVYSWEWTSSPPGFNSTMQDPLTGNVFFSTIFNLEVTDAASSCKSDPDPVIVAVEGGPLSVNPVATPSTVCLGTSTQLFALAGGGSGWYTYSWTSTPVGFTSSDANPEVTPSENTTYHLTVDDNFNLISGSTQVTVNPLPVIYLGPPDTTVCIYDTLVLSAGNSGSLYKWSNGSHEQTIMIASTGIGYEIQEYTVEVTNENGCMDSAHINIIFSFGACTGIREGTSTRRYSVFPNPNQGRFRITGGEGQRLEKIELFNLFGILVYSQQVYADLPLPIDEEMRVEDLPKGVYILHLKDISSTEIHKLVIQ
ncbi:MAG: choice-of-anchor L domain-containing protein [Bacteroidales bacterium]|nr:choice-of-anchor L domain-containing protein [Bacteroidales bacterium]